MLRITTRREADWQVIAINGRLNAAGVSELERVTAAARTAVRIELQGLRSVDHNGLDALRRLESSGIPRAGVPPYVRLLLGQTTGTGLTADRSG